MVPNRAQQGGVSPRGHLPLALPSLRAFTLPPYVLPVVDGELNDVAWQEATLVSRFHKNLPFMRLHPLSYPVEARHAYTDSNLYVSYKVYVDDTAKLVANVRERDGWTWDDDSVGRRFAMEPARPIRRHSFSSIPSAPASRTRAHGGTILTLRAEIVRSRNPPGS